nr:hypothetical protein CFP56_31719 [Quercus suber]
MHARFDRWLARPSALNLRRQLDGEPGLVFTRSCIIMRCQRRSNARTFTSILTGCARDLQNKEEQGSEHESSIPSLEGLPTRRTTYQDLRKDLLKASVHANDDIGCTVDQMLDDVLGEQEDAVEAWVAILDQQQRLHGAAGLRAVWLGLRRRGHDIPVDGQLADRLWQPFIHSAANSDWLSEILAYAQELKHRKNIQYAHLYSCVVGYYLALSPDQAVTYHDRLRKDGFLPQDALKQIVAQAVNPNELSSANDRFQSFGALYRRSDERDLYDVAISVGLTEMRHPAITLKWHRLFISHGDAPSSAIFARPDVQQLFETDGDRSLPTITAKRARSRLADDVNPVATHPKLTRANMSSLGEMHGIKPKTISDTFVAKVFATRAFSIEATLGGIGFFGIDRIGPLAVRELAVRAGSPAELSKAIATLEKMNIQFEDGVFCQLMHQVATEQNNEVFEALLRSDQHHEVYENAALQENILTSQLTTNDWPGIRVTLAVLDLVGKGANTRGWNRVLQHYIIRRDVPKVVQTMQQIQSSGIPLTRPTCESLSKNMLPFRNRGRRPFEATRPSGKIAVDRYEFVTQALMYAHDHGLELTGPWTWKYLIMNQGTRGQFESVERMILKLAESYLEKRESSRYTLHDPAAGRGIGAYLSDPELHSHLVIWSFRRRWTAPRRSLSSPLEVLQSSTSIESEPWVRGLTLVSTLSKVYGIPVSVDAVRQAFLSRMIILFGPGSSGKGLNREAQRKNQHSLARFVRHVQSLWPEMFAHIPTDLLRNDAPENHPHLLRAVFGPTWCVNKKRQLYLDVEAWTQHLLVSKQYFAKPTSNPQQIPFTYYDNTALTPDNMRWRSEHEQVLQLQAKPGAYGFWASHRRQQLGSARSSREKDMLDSE